MNKKKLVASAAALLILALSACGTAEPVPTPAETEEAVPSPSAAASLEVRLETVTDSIEEDGVTLLTYSYPSVSVTGTDAADKIESEINARLKPEQETLDSLAEAARAAYSGLDEAGRELWGGYGLYYSAEVTRSDSRVLSLYCSLSENSGGVHPNSTGFGLNYDAQTGEALTGASIDAGGLSALVRSSFNEAVSSSEFAGSFYGVGEFVDRVLDSGQWYFTDTGLALFANTDEIAPHAAGMLTVELSYGELANSLNSAYAPED